MTKTRCFEFFCFSIGAARLSRPGGVGAGGGDKKFKNQFFFDYWRKNAKTEHFLTEARPQKKFFL
jgi:hypothetical protein